MKTIDYYIARGFDLKTAEYFVSGRKKVIKAVPDKDFNLILDFDNGEKRKYNIKPLLIKNTVFEKLLDTSIFNRVYVDDCHCVAWDIDVNIDSSKVWNNKIDLSSDTCYLESVPI